MAEGLTLRVRRHVLDVDLVVDLDPLRPITVLFGPSGAGKTTLLRCLAGLERPEPGSRICFGPTTWDDDGTHVPARRREVGYLFQEHALFPHMTVLANVMFGLRRLPRRERAGRACEALAAADAGHLVDRPVAVLSGGEGQRVALARALAPRPKLLLLDEPLSALDAPVRRRLRAELRELLLGAAVPTLVVTHDRSEALTLGDRAVVLVEGRSRQHGDVAEVFSRPADPEVAAAVDVETVIPGTVRETVDGVTAVEVGDRDLFGTSDGHLEPGTPVFACIRAENVVLELPGIRGRRSPRNEVAATVVSVVEDGPVSRVELDGGFRFAAYVTRPTCEDLGLTPGRAVNALIKSTALHLIARPVARAPVGTRASADDRSAGPRRS